MQKTNLIGRIYGRLTVLSEIRRNGALLWKCKCLCGNETASSADNLNSGKSKSCGCLRIEMAVRASLKHGMANTQLYRIWNGMRQRCTNPNSENFRHYGGRGIRVCGRWLNSFENFLADMGERPIGHSLERIDNNGNYEPSNCRWATRKEQARNRRGNILISVGGETKCITDWAKKFDIKPSVITKRRIRGWSNERAVTTKIIR